MRSTPTDEGLGKEGRSPSGAGEIVHIGSPCKPLSAESGHDYLSELNTRAERQAGSQIESVGNESARFFSIPHSPGRDPSKEPFPSPRGMERGIPGGMRPS
jgi:hypothetical protein